MEDTKGRLYFEPESSKNKEKKTNKNHRWVRLAIFLVALLLAVLFVIWLLQGETITSGQFPENVRNESLVCVNKNIVYEKVNKVDSPNKELKINMIFNGKNTLNSVNLGYTLIYDNDSEAYSAEAVSHAQFNLGLQALGYDAGKFNNKFSLIGNKLVIVLNATSSNIADKDTKQYFLIKSTDEAESPKNLEEYQYNYESQGFACESSLDK